MKGLYVAIKEDTGEAFYGCCSEEVIELVLNEGDFSDYLFYRIDEAKELRLTLGEQHDNHNIT